MLERPTPHYGDHGRRPLGGPIRECAACGSDDFRAVTGATQTVNYLCRACGRCWELDWTGLHRVDPVHCPGCADGEVCFERLQRDIPQWGWWPAET